MLWQQIVSGLAMGSIYAIVAVGFILIYKATEVINFAQGDLMMVGAFIAFYMYKLSPDPLSCSSWNHAGLYVLFRSSD